MNSFDVFDQTGGRYAEDLAPLFQSLRVGGVELPNRVMTSAMTMQFGEHGLISDRHIALYEERARGGVGLMFSEQLTASPISRSPFPTGINAFDERQVDRFAALAARLSPYESRFFAQLFAAGVVGSSTAGLSGWAPVRGPSSVGAPGGEAALPLTVTEIEQLSADFACSATNVKAGGLDGVEIHGAHGWLVGQFLSPFYNRREDAYGGTVENRCRLALEIGAAIRAAVGPGFPVGIALTYDELIGADGITEGDTLAQLQEFLAAGTFDFFDLSIGSSHSEHFTIAPMSVDEGFALDFGRRAVELVAGRAAVFVAGRVVDPRMAAAAVRDGAADVVAMSRAHLADPHLVRKSQEGRPGEIRRCIGANVCVSRALIGEPVACVLSPATGREIEGAGYGAGREVEAARARKVMIIGAGPAGLRAGAIAAARGHDVTVHERRDWPGGHLAEIAWLPTRGGWQRAIDDLRSELLRAGGVLRLGSDVDLALVEKAAPDLVVLATGADWEEGGECAAMPTGIELGEGSNVLPLDAALVAAKDGSAAFGRRVVIAADETGTYAPLGLAEALAEAGCEVRYLTAASTVGPDTAVVLERAHLLPRLHALDVGLATGRCVRSFAGGVVETIDLYGGEPIRLESVDALVLALRRSSRLNLAASLSDVVPEVRILGDALVPRTTTAVLEEAERISLDI
jgi:2,4-dienoyl-CoA reductase-like NADH-dependent reductase (Old Yellow Enzyme family)